MLFHNGSWYPTTATVMKLRLIVTILTIFTSIGAAVGGYYYIEALKHSVHVESEIYTVLQAEEARKHFAAYIGENTRHIKKMASTSPFSLAVADPLSSQTLDAANRELDQFHQMLNADACYLLDATGLVLASSNRHLKESFVGKNYAFRPYFKEALSGGIGIYMAVGVTSGKRGIYYSHPVYALPYCQPIGVAVIKSSVEKWEKQWHSIFNSKDGATMITNNQGIIFVTSREKWLLNMLWQLQDHQTAELAANRQFGLGPWPWTGFTRTSDHRAIDGKGNEHLLHAIELHAYAGGWQVVQLSDLNIVYQRLSGPVKKKAAIIIGSACVLIGGLLILLFRTASQEMTQRQKAEESLRREHQYLESIMAASPVAIGIVHKRTFERGNKALLELFKFNSHSDYEGQSTRIVYASEDEYRRAGKSLYTQATKGGPAVVEAQLKRTDGSTFPGHVRISAPDPSQPMLHTIFTMSDISARVQAEKARLESEKIKSMLQTAGAVCHELNQPLTAINGHCAIGRKETLPDEPAHKRFAKILNEMIRVTGITRKLNSLARYKTRKYINDTHIVDIDKSSDASPAEDE